MFYSQCSIIWQKIKNKEGKKAKSVHVDQAVEPECEPPTKKKKKKSTLAVDPVNGHEDKTSDMNGEDASTQEQKTTDTEAPKEVGHLKTGLLTHKPKTKQWYDLGTKKIEL